MEVTPIEEGLIGSRDNSWALYGRILRWIIRITLPLFAVIIISFGILFVNSPPKRPAFPPSSAKSQAEEDESTTPSESDCKPLSQRPSLSDHDGWDNTRNVFRKVDLGTVIGSFDDAKMEAKIRWPKGRVGGDRPDVEDTCTLQ